MLNLLLSVAQLLAGALLYFVFYSSLRTSSLAEFLFLLPLEVELCWESASHMFFCDFLENRSSTAFHNFIIS